MSTLEYKTLLAKAMRDFNMGILNKSDYYHRVNNIIASYLS